MITIPEVTGCDHNRKRSRDEHSNELSDKEWKEIDRETTRIYLNLSRFGNAKLFSGAPQEEPDLETTLGLYLL
jgi:hypothetical protein